MPTFSSQARPSKIIKETGYVKRTPNKWIKALQIYNRNSDEWCIPRKDTEEYTVIKRIMDRM